jgi:hypothetical protein
LFTDEVLKTSVANVNRPELKLKMEMPISAYEQYKKQQQEKAAAKKDEESKAAKRPPNQSSSLQRPLTGSSNGNQKTEQSQ